MLVIESILLVFSNPYICSHQAQNNDETIAQKITLPLAERMVKKFIDEGKIEAEQEVQLYVMILEMQVGYLVFPLPQLKYFIC